MGGGNVTEKECELKHKPIDENMAAVWKKLNAIDVRMWISLAGIFGILLTEFLRAKL